MALKKFNPTTPGQRQLVMVDRSALYKGKPVKALTEGKQSSGGCPAMKDGLDANQDGFDDIATSTASYTQPPVAALLYLGAMSGPALATTLTTTDPTTLFEREVGSSGDVDGDGFPDLVVGFPSRVTAVGDAGLPDAGDTFDSGASGVLHGAVEVHAGSAAGIGVAARWVLLPPDGTAMAYGASLVRP